jgi:hypothetical protein
VLNVCFAVDKVHNNLLIEVQGELAMVLNIYASQALRKLSALRVSRRRLAYFPEDLCQWKAISDARCLFLIASLTQNQGTKKLQCPRDGIAISGPDSWIAEALEIARRAKLTHPRGTSLTPARRDKRQKKLEKA